MAAIPIISHTDASQVVAWRNGRPVSAAEFVAEVLQVAQQLPQRRFMVNFCNDRYRFAVGLAAALVRGQVSLLPPNQTPEMLGKLHEDYEHLYALTDLPVAALPIDQVAYPAIAPASASAFEVPAIAAGQVAAIAFTSGSTGRPAAHRKSWGGLARGAVGEAKSFNLLDGRPATLVGTVPPQHMYGLESTVLMALRTGMSLHAARPFYPADIQAALRELPGDRILVTTPVHLRALLAEDLDLPALRLIVCATAPLSQELALQAETRYGAPLHEVYGFTEAGMVATRRTVQGPQWHNLPDVLLSRDGADIRVGGGHVEIEVAFSDVIEVLDPRSFVLHGRSADLVNIAGKRSSLGYLNHQLNSIEGVHDGVFFMPDEMPGALTRPVALVVAPGMDRETLLHALRDRIDPVFLPRPLHFVATLPRNATGKLPREALLRLARECAVAPQKTTLRKTIGAGHPAAAGHFPGNPIVPGALLLQEVIDAAVAGGLLAEAACEVKAAKFLRPVRPGEEMAITLEPLAPGNIRFECSVGGEVAVSGAVGALQAGGGA